MKCLSYLLTRLMVTHITQAVLITSLEKEVMLLVALVCLSVCLFVDNIIQKRYKQIKLKFYGRMLYSTMKN